MATPQSGYSSTEIWIELEFGNVGFGGREDRSTRRKKAIGTEKRTNNKLNPEPLRHLLPSFHLSRTFLSVGRVSTAVFMFVGCCFFLLLLFEKTSRLT